MHVFELVQLGSYGQKNKIWIKYLFTQTCFFTQVRFLVINFEPEMLES